jgi:hypothetical protein
MRGMGQFQTCLYFVTQTRTGTGRSCDKLTERTVQCAHVVRARCYVQRRRCRGAAASLLPPTDRTLAFAGRHAFRLRICRGLRRRGGAPRPRNMLSPSSASCQVYAAIRAGASEAVKRDAGSTFFPTTVFLLPRRLTGGGVVNQADGSSLYYSCSLLFHLQCSPCARCEIIIHFLLSLFF